MLIPLWPLCLSMGQKPMAAVSWCQVDSPSVKGNGGCALTAVTSSPVDFLTTTKPLSYKSSNRTFPRRRTKPPA
eukprot:8458254-Lingulodinium_polyedra.AAC.1